MRLEDIESEAEPEEPRSVLSTYLSRVRAFTGNARLYLLSLLFFWHCHRHQPVVVQLLCAQPGLQRSHARQPW